MLSLKSVKKTWDEAICGASGHKYKFSNQVYRPVKKFGIYMKKYILRNRDVCTECGKEKFKPIGEK